MGTENTGIAQAIYSILLFAPGGFVILGSVITLKAIKSRNWTMFKEEIKKMFNLNISD